MSNSDDKLDQLYEHMDDNAGSPADLDAQLRAAARDSIDQSAATSSTSVFMNSARWGWATAATVLLTSVLFLSLPESQLDIPAAQSQSPAPTAIAETNDAERAVSDITEFTPTGIASTQEASPAMQQRLDQGLAKDAPQENTLAESVADTTMQPAAKPELEAMVEVSAIEPAAVAASEATVEEDSPVGDAAQAEAYSRPQSRKSSAPTRAPGFRGRLSGFSQSASKTTDCINYQHGPVARACIYDHEPANVKDSADAGTVQSRHYRLHPASDTTQARQCKVYSTTLDAAPDPSQQTDSNSFQFTNNGSNWSLSCTEGEWLLSRLPAASATAQDPH